MRLCIFTLCLLSVVVFANPIPCEIPGPYLPGTGGGLYFRSIDSALASYAIVNSDTFYVDSVIVTDSTGISWDYVCFNKFNTAEAFPDTNSVVDIYAVYPPPWGATYLCAQTNYGFPIEPPADYFDYSYFPFGTILYYGLPIPPDGYYWSSVMTSNVEMGGYSTHQIRSQLNPLPIDYTLSPWGWTFYFTRHIRINEVKPFGGDRFIEIAQNADSSVCLDGWRLVTDGIHTFDESDTLDDFLVLYESDCDAVFGLKDTCILMLIAPDGTVMNTMTWGPWPDTSLSASIEVDTVELWEVRESLAVPTPGTPNELTIGETSRAKLPSAVAIHSSYPEPFNGSATVGFEFARGVTKAEIAVFDMTGREVQSRVLSDTRAGYHETRIEALPASGSYLVRIETDRGTAERKITYLK